jgi:GNAT superfamily N-acetyltransferase
VQLATSITYLQMLEPPDYPQPAWPDDCLMLQCRRPSPSFYRYLYEEVGSQYLWTDRKKMSQEELSFVLEDPGLELWVLYCSGHPAGYFELTRESDLDITVQNDQSDVCSLADEGESVKIAYFGLLPDFVGLGLGKLLIQQAVHRGWEIQGCRRVWLHTCNHDHPAALPNYLKAGFQIYDVQHYPKIDDP